MVSIEVSTWRWKKHAKTDVPGYYWTKKYSTFVCFIFPIIELLTKRHTRFFFKQICVNAKDDTFFLFCPKHFSYKSIFAKLLWKIDSKGFHNMAPFFLPRGEMFLFVHLYGCNRHADEIRFFDCTVKSSFCNSIIYKIFHVMQFYFSSLWFNS